MWMFAHPLISDRSQCPVYSRNICPRGPSSDAADDQFQHTLDTIDILIKQLKYRAQKLSNDMLNHVYQVLL